MVAEVEPGDDVSLGELGSAVVVGIEGGLASQQDAGEEQQAVGDGAQGACVAMSALAQLGVASFALRVTLDSAARPLIESLGQAPIAGQPADDDAAFAAASGDGCDAAQGARGGVVSLAPRHAGRRGQAGGAD